MDLGKQHLCGVLAEYVWHYTSHRPHQALQQEPQEPPLREPGNAVDITARIERRQVPGGLASEKRQVSAYAGVLARHRPARW
jgi:hypothetical protein